MVDSCGEASRAASKEYSWEEVCGQLKDTVMSHAPTPVDPEYQWAVIDEEGRIQQASEEEYHA